MGQEAAVLLVWPSLLGLTEKKPRAISCFPQVVFTSKLILGVSVLHMHKVEFKMHPVVCNRV